MIKFIIDEKLESYKKQIQGIIDLSFDFLGLQYEIISGLAELNLEDILVCYSLKRPKNREIMELLKFSACTNIIFVTIDLSLYKKLSNEKLKNLKKEFCGSYVLTENAPSVEEQKDKFTRCIFYNFDLLGNIFQFVNFHQNFSKKPICNSILCHFYEKLQDCASDDTFFVKKQLWPNNEKFALSLSAEIDELYKWKSYPKALKKIFGGIFAHPIAACREYFELNFKNDEPYWNFPLLEDTPNLTYYLLKNNKNFATAEKNVAKELQKLGPRLITLEANQLQASKSFLFPSNGENFALCLKSDELKKGHYSYLDETAAQTTISSYTDSAYHTGGIAGFCFRFSDLYDIPYSANLLGNLVKLGKKPEIYFATQTQIHEWLSLRKQVKLITDKDSIEVASNFDIDSLVLKIIGNFEVDSSTGCKVKTQNNLICLSEIKKYTSIKISLKKFYKLNKRID